MGMRSVIFALCVIGSSVSAYACDPVADEKAFNDLLKARNFSESQMQQFMDKFMPLGMEISKAIDAKDNDTACSKIGDALDMVRNFAPS